MARTKKIARKEGPSPSFATKVVGNPSGKKKTLDDIASKKTKRRLHYQMKFLFEIRKHKKSVWLLVPQAPFKRLVCKILDRLA